GLAGHQDDLLNPGSLLCALCLGRHDYFPFGCGGTGVAPAVATRLLNRSGEMLSSPIFWAFVAISWKARAIMALGSAPCFERVIKVRQSTLRIGLRVASSA